jgi:hypothetical protein
VNEVLENIVSILEGSRSLLPSLLPIFFTISFLLILISFVPSFRNIRKQFNIKRITWVMLALIVVLGFFLRILTPVYLATYNDEFIHIDTGKNIVSYGKAEMCTAGYRNLENKNCQPFNEPAGFPYVVGMFFLFLGVSLASAYAVNLIIGSLLSVVVFLFCFLLFKSEKTGLYSAFVVSILPLYILLSRNIEPDTVSAFFILLTFVGFILFFKIRDLKTGIFATSILAFSIPIKQEGILLIPLVLLLSTLFLNLENLKRAIKNYKHWLLFALLIVLITPHIFHLSLELYPPLFYGKTTATGVGGKLLNLGNLSMSAPVLNNVMYGSFYPILINLFIVIGLIHAFKKHRKEWIFLILFFSFYMFVYLTYSGRILEKYLITGLIPLLCFAGVGMYVVERFAASRLHGTARKKMINFAIPLILVLVLFLWSVPYFYDVREGLKPLKVNHGFQRGAIEYKEIEAINSMGEKIDPSCYVVAEKPFLFSATDLKIIRTNSVLSNPKLVSDAIKNKGCILYFKDLYCTDFYSLGSRCGIKNESFAGCEELRQNITSNCKKMEEQFKLQSYLNYEFGKFNFTVYNISLRS